MGRITKNKPAAASSNSGFALVPAPVPTRKNGPPPGSPAGGVTPAGSPSPKLVDVSKLSKADIDRLGKVNAIMADYKIQIAPIEREKKVLETRVLAAVEQLGAEEIYPDEGVDYRLMVGAQAEEQQLAPEGLKKVLEFIGQDKFLAICGVTFGALEKALTAEQYASVVSKARTGKRTITVVPKAAPVLPTAA